MSRPSIFELCDIQTALGRRDVHLVYFGYDGFVMAHTDEERTAYDGRWHLIPAECSAHINAECHVPQEKHGYYYFFNGEYTPVPQSELVPVFFKRGRVPGCNAENPSFYMNTGPDGAIDVVCRCMVCARCANHTGNSSQGHYWGLCKVTKQKRRFHFCCPNDCELEQ